MGVRYDAGQKKERKKNSNKGFLLPGHALIQKLRFLPKVVWGPKLEP